MGCTYVVKDALADERESRECPDCHAQMQQVWWGTRKHNAQWDDSTSVLVFINEQTGEPRYPGRHDATMPAGYRREYLRSLPDVNRFERTHGVTNHVMHYDSNGRAVDDTFRGRTMAD